MIEFSADRINRAIAALSHIPGAAPQAIANAINRASETARTEAARKVRESYYIKHGDVIGTINIKKATPSDLAAAVISKGGPSPLMKFKVTPSAPQPRRRTPIIVRVKRGGGGTIRRAFVAQMQSGHIDVFNRVGQSRLPIIERYGPSIPQMLGSPTVTQWVREKAGEKLEERLNHEITRILEAQR